MSATPLQRIPRSFSLFLKKQKQPTGLQASTVLPLQQAPSPLPHWASAFQPHWPASAPSSPCPLLTQRCAHADPSSWDMLPFLLSFSEPLKCHLPSGSNGPSNEVRSPFINFYRATCAPSEALFVAIISLGCLILCSITIQLSPPHFYLRAFAYALPFVWHDPPPGRYQHG